MLGYETKLLVDHPIIDDMKKIRVVSGKMANAGGSMWVSPLAFVARESASHKTAEIQPNKPANSSGTISPVEVHSVGFWPAKYGANFNAATEPMSVMWWVTGVFRPSVLKISEIAEIAHPMFAACWTIAPPDD